MSGNLVGQEANIKMFAGLGWRWCRYESFKVLGGSGIERIFTPGSRRKRTCDGRTGGFKGP